MFILNVNPLQGYTGTPQRLESTSGKDPEQAFGELTKSSQDAEDIKAQSSKKALKSRGRKAAEGQLVYIGPVNVNEEGDRRPYSVLVDPDGHIISGRLLAVA